MVFFEMHFPKKCFNFGIPLLILQFQFFFETSNFFSNAFSRSVSFFSQNFISFFIFPNSTFSHSFSERTTFFFSCSAVSFFLHLSKWSFIMVVDFYFDLFSPKEDFSFSFFRFPFFLHFSQMVFCEIHFSRVPLILRFPFLFYDRKSLYFFQKSFPIFSVQFQFLI